MPLLTELDLGYFWIWDACGKPSQIQNPKSNHILGKVLRSIWDFDDQIPNPNGGHSNAIYISQIPQIQFLIPCIRLDLGYQWIKSNPKSK